MPLFLSPLLLSAVSTVLKLETWYLLAEGPAHDSSGTLQYYMHKDLLYHYYSLDCIAILTTFRVGQMVSHMHYHTFYTQLVVCNIFWQTLTILLCAPEIGKKVGIWRSA